MAGARIVPGSWAGQGEQMCASCVSVFKPRLVCSYGGAEQSVFIRNFGNWK